MKKVLLTLVLLVSNSFVMGATINNAVITSVHSGFDSFDGILFGVSKSVAEPGCTGYIVYLPKTHITFTETYSMLLSAYTTGNTKVEIGTSGCVNGAWGKVRYAVLR